MVLINLQRYFRNITVLFAISMFAADSESKQPQSKPSSQLHGLGQQRSNQRDQNPSPLQILQTLDWTESGLFRKCRNGWVAKVEALMAEFGAATVATAVSPFSGGDTCLILAANGNSLKMVDLLLRSGADVNHRDSNKDVPLHYAVGYRDHIEIVRRLLEEDVDIDAKEYWGRTPLRIAIRRSRYSYVEALVARGAKLSAARESNYFKEEFLEALDKPEMTEAILQGLRSFCSACIDGETCTVEDIDRSCVCKKGWSGKICNQGVCEPGWNGTFCKKDINECLFYPCKNGARCHNSLGSFSCACRQGWYGEKCQIGSDTHRNNDGRKMEFDARFVFVSAFLTFRNGLH